ncbi:MAG: helix-turn-helix domain-containing protein [Betaproteobacteria bacterium]|jgi:DNA-binding Xre family transcriptional regulator
MPRNFLFESLRAHMNARDMNYKQLSDGLGVSEGTIKRVFANNDCSTKRLDQICHFLQIELADLVKCAPKKRKLIEQLTSEQEAELAHNKPLFMVAICVMGLWTFDDMLTHLNIPAPKCTALLHRLDEIGFVEIQAGYRYRLLVARHFSWIADGPIMRLVKTVSGDYFNHRFDAPGEMLKIINVRISPHVQESLKARLEQIAREYSDQVVADSYLPLDERPPLSICIAVRAWVPQFLRDLMRNDSQLGAPQKQEKTKSIKNRTFTPPR